MDLFELENMAKNKEREFVNLIIKKYKECGLDTAIKLLKKSGICIHRDRGRIEKYDEIYKKVIKILLNDSNASKVHEFTNEVDFINDLYYKIDKMTEERINLTSDKQVIAYLVALEAFLLDCKNYDMKKHLNYPEDFKYVNVNVNLSDNMAEASGEILKYFIYKKYLFKNIHTKIDKNDLSIASRHFDFLELQKFLDDLTDLWNYYDLEKSKCDSYVKFKTVGDKSLGAVISKQKFFDLRSAKIMGYVEQEVFASQEKKEEIARETNTISINEQLSKDFIKEYLNVDNFEEKFNEVELKYLIRAYSAISAECRKFLNNKKYNTEKNITLANFCIIKSVSKWINIFIKNGIPKEYGKKIIDMLIFNKRSKDLHDCPFVNIDKYLIVVPSISSETDASRALISNLISKGINIAIKGTNFEKKIRDILSEANVKNMELKENKDEEYQCDCAFILDNDLYFAEIKNLNHPVNYRDYQRNLDEIKAASIQLDRIVDYFTGRIDVIKKKFDVNEIKGIYKIVITNTSRGQNLKIGQTFIVDKTLFRGYFKRIAPAINEIQGNKISIREFGEEYFKGKVTSSQFRDVLENDPYINLAKKRIDYIKFNFVDKFGIILEEYISKVDGVNFGEIDFRYD